MQDHSFSNCDDLVDRIKSSENYQSFRKILPLKIRNEVKAKEIINKNLGKLNQILLKQLTDLIDEPYPCFKDGKLVKGPWFGRLIKSNSNSLFREDTNKINEWFNILTDNSISVEKRIEVLLSNQLKIKGLNVGFITLMFYLLDKEKYLIWFEGQHETLRLCYSDLGKFTGSGEQYILFNERAKNFAKVYGFGHTELDWIFSTGIKVLNEPPQTWPGLDQSAHDIELVFKEQNASGSVKRLATDFYENLFEQFKAKNFLWIVRTHERGLTFLCDDYKAFMWVNISQDFISVKFFTGNKNIQGLEKGTWARKNDNLSTQPFRISDSRSRDQAVEFALQAYQITMGWRGDNSVHHNGQF